DEDWGEQVLAVVVPRHGSGLTEADLVAFCTERLAGYKRPARFGFLDRLPRTSTGKLLRRELRRLIDG
ncbi:MAG TPA: hypothetical protein VNW94_16750, partial [Streptosporangiaceae bacterium]|nr:hypothetical protein [Streptosporangiaceae bacterium]